MANIAPITDLQVDVSTKQILKIALPITLALLVPQLNFVANTVFLSNLGETELGAAGITGVYYLVFALVGNGLNSGLQSLIARRAGENRPGEIGKMFSQSIWIALLFAIAGIFITYMAAPAFLSTTLSIPKVQQESTEFLRIRIWGLPFLYLFQMGNAMLVGTNNSRYMKYGFMLEAALNIFLDYVLIYGHWGFPKLGFNGAAVASVIAEATGMLIVFGIIFYKQFHHRFSLFKHLRFDKSLSGLIFRQSSPLVMQFVLSVGAWFLFYILIENSGTGINKERPLAISNTMRNIFSVFGVFVWAFASTSNAMVSNIIGQGKKEQVLMLIRKIATLSFLCTAALCLIINSFPAFFLSIYGRDADFIAEAIPVLRTVSIALLLMSISTVWLNGVTGTANTTINLGIEVIAILLYIIYVYLVLRVWHFSLVWAWASEFLYWSIILTLSYLYLRSGRWKKKVI
jgi:multidrug resistance protein, MATE family